jgi:ABC-type uncharacterized transport system permease subunit
MKTLLLRSIRILAWVVVGFVVYSMIHIICIMCGGNDEISVAISIALLIVVRFFLRARKRKKVSN